MASTVMQQQQKMARTRSNRPMFSSSDDSGIMKQVQSTHSPDNREIDVKPILFLVEKILHRSAPEIVKGAHEHIDTSEDMATLHDYDGMLDALAYIIQKISCELECKCSGADAHGSTMAVLTMLSIYTWDAKLVICLAAFSVTYGEFWLVAQHYTTNPLAKSVALLKQLPDLAEHYSSQKSLFDVINVLIKAIMDVTKCIVEFKELPNQYISHDIQPMAVAMAHVPTAAYWAIRSMVACISQLTGLLGMTYEHITTTTEAWELSSLAHKVQNIHAHLRTQLGHCYQHIDEKRHDEYFHMLVQLSETIHMDNMKILNALIYPKDDMLPLMDCPTKTRVKIEVLRRKNVLLLVSDLDLSHEQLLILSDVYTESRATPAFQYHVVWIPILDRSIPWNEGHQLKFEELQSMMPWHTVHHPSILEPAVTKFIKEVWHFVKKPILVVLDPQGKVVCLNALHMVWIWRNLAYPFTSTKEEELWKQETWRLEFLVDGIDPMIQQWVEQEKFICLYGGEDMEWIQKFTVIAKAVTQAAGITLEMVYVGKNNSSKERARRIIATIEEKKLSHTWSDLTSIWYFWTRLESMFYSKGKSIENDDDRIKQEVLRILSFDGGEEGWALICAGSVEMAQGKINTLITGLEKFESWEEAAKNKGFVGALVDYLQKTHTPEHCSRLILPGIDGGVPEMVVCAECGRPMDKYLMYRCCTD